MVSYGQNEKFKALFMYNFTKHLEWPEASRQGDFVIAVVGKSAIADELKNIAVRKKVGFQPIKVKSVSTPAQISNAHIIYVCADKSSDLPALLATAKRLNAVVIADKQGAIDKGAGINYVVVDGKQMFEVSRENLQSCKVKVGAELLSLGIEK
ncbi:MAG: YfiR family protein [Bacteroidales bacterium]